VRELENAIQRAMVLSDGQTLELSHLPALLRNGSPEKLPMQVIQNAASVISNEDHPTEPESAPMNSSYEDEMRRFKRSLVLRTLRQNGWRKAESARALGVARGYLHRLINQLDIKPDEKLPTIDKEMKLPSAGPVM